MSNHNTPEAFAAIVQIMKEQIDRALPRQRVWMKPDWAK